MSNHLVWFRNDLRVTDHAALNDACKRAQETDGMVIPIYVVDPFWFGVTQNGFSRVGAERARFLLESLEDLDRRLKAIGGPLRIFCGDTRIVLGDVCQLVSATSLSYCEEVSTEERRVEAEVRAAMDPLGVSVGSFSPSTMCDWDHLPFPISETPEVFTKFRRLVEKRGRFSPPALPPERFVSNQGFISEEKTIEEIRAMPWFPSDRAGNPSPSSSFFVGGVTAGGKRLSHYLWETDSLSRYKKTRNGMLRVDDSSKLSSWLAFGCLSAKEVMQEVNRYESERVKNDSTYWLKFELLWRDFFIAMSAKHGPHLYRSGGLQNKAIDWERDQSLIEAWTQGLTGYPLVDANMRELLQTGYMSNRGRQNVASFLTKNLGIDWRIGAEWFESKLIDHDPSVNYGNWNYAAGVGNDAREFRWFNINKQASTYDPKGEYVKHWIPELSEVPEDWIHHPWRMSDSLQEKCRCKIGDDYPEPVVDLFHSAEINRQRHDRAIDSERATPTQPLLGF